MKADREVIAGIAENLSSAGGKKHILAVEPVAVMRQEPGSLVDEPIARGVAVMGRAHEQGAVPLGARYPHVPRSRHNGRSREPAEARFAQEAAGRSVVQ